VILKGCWIRTVSLFAKMFLAKILDQKQGDARVVDQQQVLRERLNVWLQTRPSANDLVERGILGRRQRFVLASATLERWLTGRLRAEEAERSKIPAGDFVYTAKMHDLLSNMDFTADRASDSKAELEFPAPHVLEARLRELAQNRSTLERQIACAEDAWATAAEDCRRASCSRTLPDAALDAGNILQDLSAHGESTEASLAEWFKELNALQRLLARKHCLARVVAMVEKTDAVREAVFAWGSANTLPLSTLEELPELCAGLPLNSRTVGVKRLQFLIGPLRTALERELQQRLRETHRWPHDSVAAAIVDLKIGPTEMQVIQLCADLQRVQSVVLHVRELSPPVPMPDAETRSQTAMVQEEAPWAAQALAWLLVERFRHHFWRPESELCRMDKPEWAFVYLVNLASNHIEELQKWEAAAHESSINSSSASMEASDTAVLPPLSESQHNSLKKVDLHMGLALELAQEASLFVRSRMPLLVQPDAQPLLLHTIHHLVQFYHDISAIGGPCAGQAAFSDFDANRFIETPPNSGQVAENSSSQHLQPQATVSQQKKNDASELLEGISHLRKGGHEQDATETGLHEASNVGMGARLMKGLSHLRPLAQSSAAPQSESSGKVGGEIGASLLDTLSQLAATDAESNPQAGGHRFLDVWVSVDADFVEEKIAAALKAGSGWRTRPLLGVATDSVLVDSEPEVGEWVTLIGDLFDRAGGRAECLASSAARAQYSKGVFAAGLRQVAAAARERWNALSDPLQEAHDSAIVIETLEELCLFLDQFSFAVHMAEAVDEVNTLRLGILDRLCSCFEEAVRKDLRSLIRESCVFSFLLAKPLAVMRKRLRNSNFRLVARQASSKLSATLLGHLLRQSPFANENEMALFVSNCRDDLKDVLAVFEEEDLGPLQSLWDGCSVLTLTTSQATDLLVLLKRIVRCSPSGFTNSSRPDLDETTTLEAQTLDALRHAGVEELSVDDVLAVLAKRPDLADLVDDIPSAPFSVLQDLLPLESAQSTLQLGAGALQQLGMQAPMPLAAAQASLQTGVAGLGGLAGGAKRLLAGRVKSTLGTMVAAA